MNQVFYQELIQIIPKQDVLLEEPMKKHTTFRIGGAAEYYVAPSMEQLTQVLTLAKKHGIIVTIIGNGSNLLVSDAGIRGLVIEIGKAMSGVRIEDRKLYAEAGTLLSRMANVAAEHGLSGMEFAAGIPGSVGGAVVMNAGAYGGEMKDILVSATVITCEGELLTIPAEELDLAYRHSCVPEKNYIVVATEFALQERPQEEIRALMEDLRKRRVEKQPLEYPSAGSMFKRPEGYFAGKLIMDAGLRGYRVGDAQIAEKHCGFVINCGNATAADVLQLIDDVRKKVYEQFQVELEPEVKVIGD